MAMMIIIIMIVMMVVDQMPICFSIRGGGIWIGRNYNSTWQVCVRKSTAGYCLNL